MLTSTFEILLSLLCTAAFTGLTWRMKKLSAGGALAAGAMGLWVWWRAGWPWLAPLFLFFGTSTLLGRLNKAGLAAADKQQGKARNALQVICNGGVYAVLAAWGSDAGLLMLLSMAVATADTWSSELGMYFRGPTFDILRLRRVPVGLSGGVSLAGTLAGLAGAALISLCGLWLFPVVSGMLLLVPALGGFFGMLADSVLGAGLQARYEDHSGALTDRPSAVLRGGWRWMTNDVVNLLSNAALTAAGYFVISQL